MAGKLTQAQEDELWSLREALVPLANKLELAPMCWIGDGDAGPDYCWDCAAKEVERLKAADPALTAFVDGGWVESHESDGHAACSVCGVTLQHSFSQYGLEEELGTADSFKVPTDPEVAYGVINILEAARWSKSAEIIESALIVGRRATANVPNLGRSIEENGR